MFSFYDHICALGYDGDRLTDIWYSSYSFFLVSSYQLFCFNILLFLTQSINKLVVVIVNLNFFVLFYYV